MNKKVIVIITIIVIIILGTIYFITNKDKNNYASQNISKTEVVEEKDSENQKYQAIFNVTFNGVAGIWPSTPDMIGPANSMFKDLVMAILVDSDYTKPVCPMSITGDKI